MVLDIYLADHLVGKLRETKMHEYELDILDHSQIISNHFIDLENPIPFDICGPFFENILPEDKRKAKICKALDVHKKDDFNLLSKIGRETAGAISVVHEGEKPNILDAPDLNSLTHQELIDKAKGDIAGIKFKTRISLAGAQAKASIVLSENNLPEAEETKTTAFPIHTCENRSLSNFIIKPEVNPDLPHSVDNEYFCMTLARAVGIDAADVYKCFLHGDKGLIPALLVKRFDRYEAAGHIRPYHMEDLCQVLGLSPDYKYQEYSAVTGNDTGPGISDLVTMTRKGKNVIHGIQQITKLIIFNYIVENQDAHGKNFSFIYKDAGKFEFAPAYDLISTCLYDEMNEDLAMHIGGEYNPALVGKEHFQKMCKQTKLGFSAFKKEAEAMIGTLKPIIEETQATKGKATAERKIAEVMAMRCYHLSQEFGFGFDFNWDDDAKSTAFLNPQIHK